MKFTVIKRFIISLMYVLIAVFSSPVWSQYEEWREVGPGGGGFLPEFAFDAKDYNRVYVTSDVVGVFISDDSGDNWRWSSYGAPKTKAGIAVDPSNPNVLYTVGPDGIYQSSDRAGHWRLVYSKGNNFTGVNNVLSGKNIKDSIFGIRGSSVAVSQSGTVYVCTISGDMIISRNRGMNWESVPIAENEIMTVIPVDENRVVTAVHKKGIYLSEDEGRTWRSVLSRPDDFPLALAVQPAQRRVLYALIGKPSVITHGRNYSERSLPVYLFRSDDGGTAWNLVYTFDDLMIENGRRLMDVNREGTIIILSVYGPIRSSDGGHTWSRSKIIGTKDDGYIYKTIKGKSYAPQTIYADNRSTGRWFLSDMTAVYRSDDDGRTWHYKVRGLRQDGYWVIRVNPSNQDIVIVSDLDHGLIQSSDAGKTWENITIIDPFEECDQVRFSPNDHEYNSLYALYFYPYPFIAKSNDAGQNWTVVKQWKEKRQGEVERFCLTRGEKYPVMYVGAPGSGILRSDDEGETWQLKTKGLPRPDEINYIEFLESDKYGNVYAGVKSWTRKTGGVYKSTDRGEHWFPINLGFENLDVRRNSFEIDPNNPDILWVGVGTGGYRSQNGGKSWEKRIEGGYCSAILVEPGNSDIVYVSIFAGGDIIEQFSDGVYKSIDGGKFFFRISGDLSRTIGSTYQMRDMEYGWRGTGFIWAAPYEGGILYTVPPVLKEEQTSSSK